MSQPLPGPPPGVPVSPSAAKQLTKDELEARIVKRKKEMDSQPCYRCTHSAEAPAQNCACCFWAHTPLPDGSFEEAA